MLLLLALVPAVKVRAPVPEIDPVVVPVPPLVTARVAESPAALVAVLALPAKAAAVTVPVKVGEAKEALASRAAMAYSDRGLRASDVLSTLARPTWSLVMPVRAAPLPAGAR